VINIKLYRNIANHGRGSEMTSALHELCDELEKLYEAIENEDMELLRLIYNDNSTRSTP